ncbi:MAG: transferase [Anaerolineae bacterium]|jgi:acetyltransferase-like isoleucine patch superfamily enzyme|nr:transferase [Candidatus Jacksonbacteria bacterium]MBT7070416.1 transferase [Anaerolineae bacterium]MBT7601148.1 transferase [Anaerolineae bacterium]MBT7990607.1 transferase [Anaerolineae bacterium]
MIHKTAIVETNDIGENVEIKEYVVVHKDVVIGDNSIIHPFVVIEDGVKIGNGVEIFPGTHVGKPPRGAGATARPIHYEKKITIGDGCALGPNATIYYDVQIGSNTLIGDGASIRELVRIGHHCILSRLVTVNYETIIGDHTKIMDSTHITGNCVIGRNVFISVLVSTVNDNIVVTRSYDEDKILGPIIEDNATIGAGACVLPGVRIGEGSMVGANAVVTKNVPNYDVVLGVPAKKVKNLLGKI